MERTIVIQKSSDCISKLEFEGKMKEVMGMPDMSIMAFIGMGRQVIVKGDGNKVKYRLGRYSLEFSSEYGRWELREYMYDKRRSGIEIFSFVVEILLMLKFFILYIFKGKKPVVYISGAISKVSDTRRNYFNILEREYKNRGYFVINPIKLHWNVNKYRWYYYMRLDLIILLLIFRSCENCSILLIPGWGNSRGASAEVSLAESLDIPVIEVSESFIEDITHGSNK